MVKRKRTLLISMVLLLVLLAAISISAFAADNGPYRIVLRYYDPLQITYTVKYPVGDSRDEWTGPEDVPIGGVGVPDPDNKFVITEYISSQIYCVDPFTPFHNQVPELGGSWAFDHDTNAWCDTVYGFVSAAPWVMSGTMQIYGNAVRWIAANGYRGEYNFFGDDDEESKKSVARLNKMFPDIGLIDKEIAVMATKVAIWKIVAGDNIQIVRTTLDKDVARLRTFEKLVQALVSEAEYLLKPSPRIYLPGEVTTTTFDAEIVVDDEAFYDKEVDDTYNYYGPMTVKAMLKRAPAGVVLPDLEKIFLTVSGLNSEGVCFVSEKSDDTHDELPEGILFGTDRYAQYIDGDGSDDTWISKEFYVAIPTSRDYPENGDQLLVKAMAMAPGVEVEQGTPVVYAFAQNDVQDWNEIQAFIGGASEGVEVTLYAEASWHTGGTSLGDLLISKQVKNATPDDFDHEFTFAVYYNDNRNFDPVKRLKLADYPVHAAYSVDTVDNTFTLKNGGLAYIQALPMVVGGGDARYEYYYWVEEIDISGQDFDTPHFEISIGEPLGDSVYGERIGPFQLDADEDMEVAFVTVTNTYERGTGDLIINKRLVGSYEDWGVDESTFFSVRVKDATNNTYLLFEGTGPEYTCIGNSGSNNSNTGGVIKISAGQQVTITKLWANVAYEVEEISGAHYDITYQGNGVMFSKGQNSTVTVVNTYEHGTGDLVIRKQLADNFTDWGVDETTVFSVRVKDATNNNYLLFSGAGPDYICTGNSHSSDSSTGDVLKISAGQPVTVTNLWANAAYEVEELDGAHYDITYQGNGVLFNTRTNTAVTVTNTYEPGTGELIINKRLAGSYTDWGVDESTLFSVRVKDVTNDNYLQFSGDGPVYVCTGANGTGDVIKISAGQPVTVQGLSPGNKYEVEEISGANYDITYQGNGVTLVERQNSTVTVINTYKHGTGELIINKRLAGNFMEWGVNELTEFSVRIKDVTYNNYLLFSGAGPVYTCIGNNNSSDSRTAGIIKISAGQPVTINNIWINAKYEVEEISGANYAITYQGNGVLFTEEQSSTVTITNTYKPDEPNKPGEPEEPGRPGRPGEPGEPEEPGEPGRPREPGEPDEPGEPEKPKEPGDPGVPGKPREPGRPGIPQTSDNSNPAVAIAILILGIGFIAGAEWFRRRKIKV